jgi:beta-galactosidase
VRDIAEIEWTATGRADVALVFDYASAWAWEVQPQGKGFSYFSLVFSMYRALRRLGLNVDIVSPANPDLAGRKMVLIPGLFAWSEPLLEALRAFDGDVLIGPRTGSKTAEFRIPDELPPGYPGGLRVLRVESLREDMPIAAEGGGAFVGWREFVEGGDVVIRLDDGEPALVTDAGISYLCGWPDDALALRVVASLAQRAGVAVREVPEGLRLRQRGDQLFVFNYDEHPHDLRPLGYEGVLAPAGVAVFKA